MLSSLYAQKESYTLKELVELTDQPEVRLLLWTVVWELCS